MGVPVNLAIVPAKGNSRRLPGKLLRNLAGRPLLYHTLDALHPVYREHILVASDSPTILDMVRQYGRSIMWHELPEETTTQTSTVLDSVKWLIQQPIIDDYFNIGLYLPTCPFRTTDDVRASLDLFLTGKFDGVVGTTDYSFPPQLGLVVNNGCLRSFDPSDPWITGNTRSQNWEGKVIRPNGAVYLKCLRHFRRYPNFYAGRVAPYHMPRSRSIDIDTVDDFTEAERQLQARSNDGIVTL